MHSLRRRAPLLLALATFLVALWTLPVMWCRQGSTAWLQGNVDVQTSLARTVVRQVGSGLGPQDFHSGNALFDREWLFGTHLMAGIGLCQIAAQHPETAPQWTPAIEQCIKSLLSEQVREFDAKSWGADALLSLNSDQGHAAYLGYLNFLLGLYREVNPSNQFTQLNDQISAALARRFAASASGLIATYPDQWYPVDNTPGLASLALHGRATGHDYSALLQREEQIFRSRLRSPSSGLLIQATNHGGEPVDVGRGSGTALGVFFLSRAWPDLSREMFDSIRRSLASGLFGFGAIREYPHDMYGGGDVDSGPVILGFGFSATGFSISGARACGHGELFSRLYASAILAGAPVRKEGDLDFLTAGPLGNAILLAMFTTPRLP